MKTIRTTSLALLGALALIACSPAPETGSMSADDTQMSPMMQAMPMGDYEVVLNWPKPLPDDDISHDGWTWGSGAGVFPENPDDAWEDEICELSGMWMVSSFCLRG